MLEKFSPLGDEYLGKIMEIYEEIKKKAGIERIRAENIEEFRKTLKEISLAEITREHGIKDKRQTTYLKNLLFDFFLNPIQKQRKVLYFLYRYSRPPTSIKAIHKMLGFGNPYSCQRFVSTRILQDMGLIEVQETKFPKFRISKVNRELFKKYWPNIERWELKEKKAIPEKRAKKGQQMEKFFLILFEKIKEKGFTPEIYDEIRRINRGDFKERGWDIKNRVLTKIKRRTLKMPIVKLVLEIKKIIAGRDAQLFYLQLSKIMIK